MCKNSRNLPTPWADFQIHPLLGPYFTQPLVTLRTRIALTIDGLCVENNLVRNATTNEERPALRIALAHERHSTVVIIPVQSDGRCVLVGRYRYAIGRWSLEFPRCELGPNGAGWKHPASEWLLEVTGFKAEKMAVLGAVDIDPSALSTSAIVMLAEECSAVQTKPADTSELIAGTLPIKFEDLDALVRQGEITCGLTLSAICIYRAQRQVAGMPHSPGSP